MSIARTSPSDPMAGQKYRCAGGDERMTKAASVSGTDNRYSWNHLYKHAVQTKCVNVPRYTPYAVVSVVLFDLYLG